jgi:ATP-dependent exoDNAse (exonuclease V) beta subunit
VEQLTIDLDAGLAEERPEPGALTLTSEQQEAVRRRAEPILLSAAAGSGKTSVLVERFVQAVCEDGLAPAAVLAITFTERAAGELRARVRARLLELGDREAARDTETAFIGTFHGFCARLLRAHPLPAGLDPEFEILDAGQSARLRERAFEDSLVAFLADGDGDAVDLLAAYGVDIVRQMIEQVHGELRSRGERRPRLPEPDAGPDAGQTEREAVLAVGLLDRLLGLFGERYERLKEQRNGLDFDDLELIAGELLAGNQGLRDSWSERFELLMVDEFQDTNPRQMAILVSLQRANLFTVGDELQSIYGFRHADVSLFRERRATLETTGGALALTGNFRSHGDVLEVVNTAFADRFERFAGLVRGRAEAGEETGAGHRGEPLVELLLTSRNGWDEHERVSAEIAEGLPDAARWRQAEARLLAQRVTELVAEGRAMPGEIVVLLRASGEIEVFERALQLRGLRTLATVGTFWGRQQIGDLHSYLRALANPRDEEALYSALASPLVGCSRDGLAVLASAAREQRRGVWETALAGVAAERLAERDRLLLEAFCPWFERERAEAARLGISQMLERGMARGGYEAHVLGLDWPERRLANVRKLLRLARTFEAQEGRDLRAFVDHVERLKSAEAVEPEAPVEGVEPDTVRLMTIHAAKGLEFPVVCVADLGRKPPSRSSNLLAEGQRVGLRLRRPGEGEGEKTLDFEQLRAERWAREREEEDRVLYVAMTRARDRLLLSGTVEFSAWPKPSEVPPPVNWLGPALCAKLPELGQEGPGVHVLPVGERGEVSLRATLSDPTGFGAVLLETPPRTPLPDGPGEPAATDHAAVECISSAPVRAAPTPAPPATLSYTSLSLLERCGYRYYLERVLRMPEERAAAGTPRGESLEARARGTLVHRLMETHDFAAAVLPGERQVAEAAAELGLQAGPAEREEITALIGEALASPLAARIAAARGRRREHPFAFSLSAQAPLITGVIDLLCEETDGTALVVDYKSDRLSAEQDPETLVARDYAVQRLLYALAVLRQGALVVEIVHWFLARPLAPAVARYTLAERPTLEEELAERLAEDWAEPYSVTSRPHRGLCLTCPGRGGMCSWSEQETMREDPGEPLAPGQ